MFRPSKRPRGMFGGMGPMQQQQYYGQYPGGMEQEMGNQSSLYPSMQFDRMLFEINENRRRISNLNRRVTRLENYLRIRDNDSFEKEMKMPDEFSM